MRALQCSDPSSRRRRHPAVSASRETPVTGALHCTRTPARWQAASMRSRTSRELLEAGKYLKLSASVASSSPMSSSNLRIQKLLWDAAVQCGKQQLEI